MLCEQQNIEDVIKLAYLKKRVIISKTLAASVATDDQVNSVK